MAFIGELKQSTTVTITVGPLVAASDGDTEQTGKTLADTDFFLSKNGGVKAVPSDTNDATEDAHGIYRKQIHGTDTGTLGLLTVYIHFTDSLYLRQDYQVVTANYWDSKYSTDKLQVDVTQWIGTAVTLSTGNKPDVNIDEISDDTTAPGNLELMFDGTGYAGGTIKLQTDLTQILAHTLTDTGTQLADAFQKFFDVAVPTGTINSLPDAIPGAATGLLTLATVIENSVPLKHILAGIFDVIGNKSNTSGTIFRNDADDTDRLTVTVDATGRLTAVWDFSDL